jgi:hypothetical protein
MVILKFQKSLVFRLSGVQKYNYATASPLNPNNSNFYIPPTYFQIWKKVFSWEDTTSKLPPI